MSTPAFAYPTLCQERKGWGTRTFVARTTEKLIWTGLNFRRPCGTLAEFFRKLFSRAVNAEYMLGFSILLAGPIL
jgi:hypothetical protein